MSKLDSMGKHLHKQTRSLSSKLAEYKNRINASRSTKNEQQSAERKIRLKPSEPDLTVIVPAYNVEDYLEECVESIISQTYTNWEMYIIDDGSPGRTGEIADELAARDPRVTAIHQQNRGLGGARNTGLRISTTPYITFIDSDDVLPVNAFKSMMESLKSSGSDVAIGAMERFNSKRRWTPFWVDLAHDETRVGITAKEHIPIMWDVFACNKIFKRQVWDRIVGEFPEGTLYEDQECTAKLYVNDVKIDVLEEVVYYWRLREDGQSITQNKSDLKDLSQRLTVAESVRPIVEQYTDEYVDYWYTKCLGEDFFYYIREVPRADEEFYNLLSRGLSEFWTRASDNAVRGIAPDRRWLSYLAAYGTREDLIRLLVAYDSYRAFYRVTVHEDGLSGEVPGLEQVFQSMPRLIRNVSPAQLEAQAIVSSVVSENDGSLVLELYGYVPNLNAQLSCSAKLRQENVVISVASVENIPGRLGHLTSDPYTEHSTSHFRIRFAASDIDSTFAETSTTESEAFDLEVELKLGTHVWVVKNPKRTGDGAAAWPLPGEVTSGGNRFILAGDPAQSTRVKFLKPRFLAHEVSITSDVLSIQASLQVGNGLTGFEHFDLNNAQIRIKAGARTIASANCVVESNKLSANCELPGYSNANLNQLKETWTVDVLCGSKLSAPIAVTHQVLMKCQSSERFIANQSGYGYLVVEDPKATAQVDELKIVHGTDQLVISGTFTSNPNRLRTFAPSLALVGKKHTISADEVQWDRHSGRYTAVFNLVRDAKQSDVTPLPNDSYILQALLPAGQKTPATLWATVSVAMLETLPIDKHTRSYNCRILGVGKSRSLGVEVTGLGDSRTNRAPITTFTRAAELFTDATRRVAPKTVFFESFTGNTVSDSPLEIDRIVSNQYPDVTRYWSVRDLSISVPPGAVPLVAGTEAWNQRLADSQILVNNNNFPHYFRKASSQRYIQTWHGTPLKRIGNHVPGANLSLRYRALMQKEAETEWDLLLAQSPWAEDMLRSAFNYSGEVFNAGYPRNDTLMDSARVRAANESIRSKYRILDDQLIVLYAPTWRDHLKDVSGLYSRVDYLGVRDAAKSLGEKYKILYRGHANSVFAQALDISQNAIDVSLYPDVNDLLAAADVLLTDYSSIMFDFIATGKPIGYIVPDLVRYRDETRGFYFDLEEAAPGPLFTNGRQAIEWIADGAPLDEGMSEKYIAFKERFAPHDDGNAVLRMFEQVSWIDKVLS